MLLVRNETSQMSELAKRYNPRDVEQRWYALWRERGYFHADETAPGMRFAIVIPPPNVTGSLTMGHVLNNTLQDILIRYHRMCGENTLWLPGTDHAGIATQNVVERSLAAEGLDRHRLGRERFLARVWAWKERYGSAILEQLQRLGCSCDWERERFTMDDGLSRAVREVFVRLYEKDLIYRGRRITHWCPRCRTALSDEEAVTSEGGEPGHLWYIRYPQDGGGDGVVVATTRPETMLGDTGVAVHPDDGRYQGLVGKRLVLPLLGRLLPVVADELVDPAFGTGAVKVTPAHDANDFEMSQRHGLPPVCIMSPEGAITTAGGAYAGLERMAARERIVADLRAQGLLVKTEPYRVPIRRCQRCNTVIEPYLSNQWFVRMKPLAQPAIEAVRSGQLRLIPARWMGVYLHWLDNIRDWCISRQLWWGHRIPVWYCDSCGGQTAGRADPECCRHCGSRKLQQDPDVVDTWFSSWLWPFSTMGWPEQTPTLQRFYPTDVLITGGDIIFFWVARMVMAGYEFAGQCPFHTVFFHSIIRDTEGRKMSKSLRNSPDPLAVIEQYGADALRFTVTALAPATEDLRFASEKTEFGRNFANKIWNATRFVLQNLAGTPPAARACELSLADRWILSRLQGVTAETRRALDELRFNDAGMTVYRFIWGEFCDWYIEFSKLALHGDVGRAAPGARAVLLHVLEQAMRLLHPFMPFLTEEVWQALPARKPTPSIMRTPFPEPDKQWVDQEAESRARVLIQLVRAVRNIRSELGLPLATRVTVRVVTAPEQNDLSALEPYLLALARADRVEFIGAGQKPSGEPSAVVDGLGEVYVPLRGVVDVAEVRHRIQRDLMKVTKELGTVENKLGRRDFIEKAPAAVVEKERLRADQLQERKRVLARHLETLAGAF